VYLGTGYGSKGRELLAQALIIQTVVKIFDVQIDTLVGEKNKNKHWVSSQPTIAHEDLDS